MFDVLCRVVGGEQLCSSQVANFHVQDVQLEQLIFRKHLCRPFVRWNMPLADLQYCNSKSCTRIFAGRTAWIPYRIPCLTKAVPIKLM